MLLVCLSASVPHAVYMPSHSSHTTIASQPASQPANGFGSYSMACCTISAAYQVQVQALPVIGQYLASTAAHDIHAINSSRSLAQTHTNVSEFGCIIGSSIVIVQMSV